jgi:hypothetical protein
LFSGHSFPEFIEESAVIDLKGKQGRLVIFLDVKAGEAYTEKRCDAF